MPKGVKTCHACNAANGPRAFVCKKCNQPFAFKAKSKEQKNTKIIHNVNWRELQPGDRIKVAGGPYFFSNGNCIPMGYKGKFVVESLDKNGIIARGVDKHSGYCHIYMGRDVQNKETLVWKVKHKLVKLKQKDVVN